MKFRVLIPLIAALTGCPTPPETSTGGIQNAPKGPAQNRPVQGVSGKSAPPIGAGQVNADGTVNPGVAEVNTDGGATLVMVQELSGQEGAAKQTQDTIKAGSFVTIGGKASCTGCKGKIVVRVMPHIDPESPPAGGPPAGPPAPLTSVSLDGPGNFKVAVPKGDSKVVLEILADEDSNGIPSEGERFAVLHMNGELITSKDHSGLKADLTAPK